jgi:hypothetical protein
MVLGATLLVSISATAQPQVEDSELADRLVAASKIYSFVQQYFAHWEAVRRNEIEAAYRGYITYAARSHSRRDFDLATLQFMARFPTRVTAQSRR